MRRIKLIPKLFNAHISSKSLRLLSSHSISTPTTPDADDLSSTADEICHLIRCYPRWESTLLTRFPPTRLAHQPLLTRVLTSPSLTRNPILTLRLLLFLSSNRIPVPSTSLTTCLSKCLSVLFNFKSCPNLDQSVSTFLDILSAFDNFTPPVSIYNSVLAACLRCRRHELVFHLYKHMRTHGDETTAGFIIQAFCKEGKLLDGYQAIREFARNGVHPDVAWISRLVAGFAGAGNYGKVSELLHLMIGCKRMPDMYTYQAIIRGLCDNGMGAEGLRIFDELRLRGYPIDLVTYSTMIDGLGKMGRMEEARGLWREMVERGMQPNCYTYCAVIDGYFKCGNLEEGMKLYNEMIEMGFKETTVSCNILINGLCLNGKMSEAVGVFEKMANQGIEKDVITYNTMIQGLCREGKTDEATRFYNEALLTGLKPTVSTYTPLILVLCEQGKVNDAVELVMCMKDKGLEPLVSTNDCIITSFCKAGRAEEGLTWLVNMLERNLRPRPDTFNTLAGYLSLTDRVDDVIPVVNAMFEIGCSVERSVCHLLIDKLCGGDGRLQAEEVFDKILLTDE